MKEKTSRIKFLLYFFVGAVLVTGILVAAKKSKTATPVPTNSKKEDEIQYEVDNNNDGLYVNHKYRFIFEYSEKQFPYQTVGETNEQKSFFEKQVEDKSSADGWNYGGLKLFVSVQDYKQLPHLLDAYQENKALEINKPKYSDSYLKSIEKHAWPDFNEIKVKDLVNDNVEGHLIYKYMSGGGEGIEPSYSYIATWKKDDYLVVISLIDFENDRRKSTQKQIIEGIIRTLKFN